MYSNNNDTDMYILDDETVPQYAFASVIFIPGDQVYTNGTATGIRMKLGSGQGFNVEEDLVSGISVYLILQQEY